jgi:hypothetical protein
MIDRPAVPAGHPRVSGELSEECEKIIATGRVAADYHRCQFRHCLMPNELRPRLAREVTTSRRQMEHALVRPRTARVGVSDGRAHGNAKHEYRLPRSTHPMMTSPRLAKPTTPPALTAWLEMVEFRGPRR